MKRIAGSIVLNIIGQVFILGSIAKNILDSNLNSNTMIIGTIFLLISLLVLLFHKTEFRNIKGTLVSSKATIVHKYFSTVIFIGSLQFVIYYFIYDKFIVGNSLNGVDILGLFIFAFSIGAVVIAFKFRQIKFDNTAMYISNFYDLKKVPLTDVKWVKISLFPLAFKVSYTKNNKQITDYFMVNTGFLALVIDNKLKKFKEVIKRIN